MYSFFTREEKFNFAKQSEMLDFIFTTKGLSTMAKVIYNVMYAELKYLFNNNMYKEDDKGFYIELAREVIGNKLNLCSHTVAKYIKELQRYGLLIDRRMGLKLCNRIYLKYRSDAKRYDKNKKLQKESDVKSANNTSQVSNPLINKAKDIVSQVTYECLPNKTLNQMLILVKDNLDDLNISVQNCFGREPIKSYAAMIIDSIKRHMKNKDKPVKESYKPKTKKPISNKVEKHNSMASHDFDLDGIEKAQQLRISLMAGTITQEEYDDKISELNLGF